MSKDKKLLSKQVLDALKAVPDAKSFIANELRSMAKGKEEYAGMIHMPPWSIYVWLAAADLLLDDKGPKRG